MATLNPYVQTISVEKVAHDKMREVAETILKETGLRIDSVQFQWVNSATVADRNAAVILSVRMDTTT